MIQTDDDEKQTPPFRFVSDDPTGHEQRRKALAKMDVEQSLAQFAASFLRSLAGSEGEAGSYLPRLLRFLDALRSFHAEFKRGLTAAELQDLLRWESPLFDRSDGGRKWQREHGMDMIVKGALRLAAHKVLCERPHFGGKYSEGTIEDGISQLEQARQTRRSSGMRTTVRLSSVQGGMPVDAMPSATIAPDPSATIAPDPNAPEQTKQILKANGKSASKRKSSFGLNELRELRKAIKANDKQRIAELRAKIRQPRLHD